MIEIENFEVFNIEGAIRGMRGKGYRKCKNGRYETFVSNHSKNISLGTYDTKEEAVDAVYRYRQLRFASNVCKYEDDIYAGKVFEDSYIAYPSGNIYNLHGKKIAYHTDKCGYSQTYLNGRNINVHRVIATLFVENLDSKPCVNHKDGNKLNNNAENLEWCTHSENTIHAYRIGLERKVCGEEHHAHKLNNEAVKYIRQFCVKGDKEFGFAALAKRFNVDRSVIADVFNNRTWRNVV